MKVKVKTPEFFNNLDFGKIALTTLGEAAGLAGITQLNRLAVVQKIQKPVVKGLISYGIGTLLVPFLADRMGFVDGKGKNAKQNAIADVATGVGNAFRLYGLGQVGYALAPKIFPAVSGEMDEGMSGYENSAYLQGIGITTEEEEQVSGYENSAYLEGLEGIGEELAMEEVSGADDEYL